MSSTGLCWIRRDLRLHDHPALKASLDNNDQTYLCFILDPTTLEPLKQKSVYDKRVHFIAQSLLELHQSLQQLGAGLIIVYGEPLEQLKQLVSRLKVNQIYFNRDYTPYALTRDASVTSYFQSLNVPCHSFQDHVIFEPDQVLTKDQSPYKVFTPYSKAWLSQFKPNEHARFLSYALKNIAFKSPFNPSSVEDILDLAGFKSDPPFLAGGTSEAKKHLDQFSSFISRYDHLRDFPALDHTSKMSVYLRHGCISIRELVNFALKNPSSGATTWLKELIWREFYQMIIYHFPHSKDLAFKPAYQELQYPGLEEHFEAWKTGQTGFPIIDAAMRCLNQTGWMHNRLRMITASFLCKILLYHWKAGERYFAWKLLDYEMPSNNGGWQWASGTGCDAVPYFRIFNPWRQSCKFDPEGDFIRTYCPELSSLDAHDIHRPSEGKNLPFSFELGESYPREIVDYTLNRSKAIALYKL